MHACFPAPESSCASHPEGHMHAEILGAVCEPAESHNCFFKVTPHSCTYPLQTRPFKAYVWLFVRRRTACSCVWVRHVLAMTTYNCEFMCVYVCSRKIHGSEPMWRPVFHERPRQTMSAFFKPPLGLDQCFIRPLSRISSGTPFPAKHIFLLPFQHHLFILVQA